MVSPVSEIYCSRAPLFLFFLLMNEEAVCLTFHLWLRSLLTNLGDIFHVYTKELSWEDNLMTSLVNSVCEHPIPKKVSAQEILMPINQP